MNSSRRIALSLGLATLFGGGLLFSYSIANGQPIANTATNPAPSSSNPASPLSNAAAPLGAPSSSGAAAPGSASGFSTVSTTTNTSPVLRQTIGISPAQPVRQRAFNVFGGTGVDSPGSESYDLQSQNVYSLLRQRGVPIPNILYPTSTAKPSFIIERLIVLSVTGAGSSSGGGGGGAAAPAQPSAPSGGKLGGGPDGGSAAAAPKGPTDTERTVTDVRRVVDAEISRGSGRLGGDHRRKLQLLRAALVSLEQANQPGNGVAGAIGSAISGAQSGQGQTKVDPREIFYGIARRYARRADLLAPKGF